MSDGQHSGLSPAAWKRHPRGRQILMIANEMNRASKLFGAADRGRLQGSYERVLALADLTVQAAESRSLRRELLRWRDLVAEQFAAPEPDERAHGAAFRALLQLHPDAWRQLPFVTGAAAFPARGRTEHRRPGAAVSPEICAAIRECRVLEFEYEGRHRTVHPYCHGWTSAAGEPEALRAVQVAGESRSGHFGKGKLWTVARMSNVRLAADRFAPADPDYNPDDTAMARIHCRVER